MFAGLFFSFSIQYWKGTGISLPQVPMQMHVKDNDTNFPHFKHYDSVSILFKPPLLNIFIVT